MIILPQITSIKWNANNVRYFSEKGYIYTKIGDLFDVYVLDLPLKSKAGLYVICDYCGKIVSTTYIAYNRALESDVKKFCCFDCVKNKREEVMMFRYGVTSASQHPIFKNKAEKTNLLLYGSKVASKSQVIKDKTRGTFIQRYGVEHALQIKEIKLKQEETMEERYGVKYAFQNEDIYNKQKESVIEKYGVENVFSSSEVKKKIHNTNIRKYGFSSPMQNETIKKKALKTMYEKGTSPTSKQQNYLHRLIGGELNYPFGECMLDVAFPNEFICVEYDGGGHDLSVKIGMVTKEAFSKRENARMGHVLNTWRVIKIISPKDFLPSDEMILIMIDEAKEYLINKNKKLFTINLGLTRNHEKFGLMRKIK